MNFFEKLFCEKRQKINVFWKENKKKGVNKDGLQSGGVIYHKKLHYNLNFSFDPLFLLCY